MAGEILILGGGNNPLALRVVAQSTRPAAREGLIWVKSALACTGWIFTAASANVSGVSGRVWFQTGTASNAAFNAMRASARIAGSSIAKRMLYLYVIRCRQYTGSAWELKPCEIYINGSWVAVPTSLSLFDNGAGKADWSGEASLYGKAEIDSSISLYATYHPTSGSDGSARVWLTNPVSLGEYGTLNVTAASVAAHGAGSGSWVGIASGPAATPILKTALKAGENALDLSSITGSGKYYIVLWSLGKGASSGDAGCTVGKVELGA